MTSYHALFEKLWQDYTERNPNAYRIYALLKEAQETVVNDHIAFRTFNDPRVNIDVIAKPFINAGYVLGGTYDFSVKKLDAKHFQHETDKNAPKVFISELRTEEFSDQLQITVKEAIDNIPKTLLKDPESLLLSGRPWSPIPFSLYEDILKESEFAAWLLAYGYGANHFTISVNHLGKLNTLEKLNEYIVECGYQLNEAGGVIKGSPEVYFEQSSTKAEMHPLEFADGPHEAATCYYEFARRYKKPDGMLFEGFITSSADKLFESTNR